MRCDVYRWCIMFGFCFLISSIRCSIIKETGGAIKEKFKEFLRKAVYGITPTTVITTLRPRMFPEEYDPVAMLEWQIAEERRKGIVTLDYAPRLTESTKLWEGYWGDPTFDDLTWGVNPLFLGTSNPTTIKRYWESDFDHHERSIEELAKYWMKRALATNAEWERTFITTEYVPLEQLHEKEKDLDLGLLENKLESSDREFIDREKHALAEQFLRDFNRTTWFK